MSDLFSKIKEITELDSIAGYEHSVRNYLRSKITPLVDDVQTDGLGGIFGIKTLMLKMHHVSWSQRTWTKLVSWLAKSKLTVLCVL